MAKKRRVDWTYAKEVIKRAGVPIYEWGKWDSSLLTKKQLEEAGYQTGKALPKPAGAVLRKESPDGVMWLYDPKQATPKRKPSAALLAALEKGRENNKGAWLCKCGARLGRRNKQAGACDDCQHQDWLEDVKIEAAQMARRWMNHADWLILDTETTGLEGAQVVEIAIINMQGEMLLNQRVCPRDPSKLIEKTNGVSAADIHGIYPEHVVDCPKIADLYPQIKQILEGKTVIIYNSEFDTGVLSSEWRWWGVPSVKFVSKCAMHLYARYCGEWSEYWGNFRWQPLPSGDHSALGDCLATLRVLREMAEYDPTPSPYPLAGEGNEANYPRSDSGKVGR